MPVNLGLFCHWLVSLLRYSHDGFRARKGEEDCLQFSVVYSVHDEVGFVLPTYLKNVVSVPRTIPPTPMYYFQ